MCFTEPEWKFLNDKHHEISNFYGLPKIHKSKIIESAINNVANNGRSSVFTDCLRPFIGNFVSKFHENDRPILSYRAKNN